MTDICLHLRPAADCETCRIKDLEGKIEAIQTLVNEQAEDDGLWAVPLPLGSQNIVEAYLQQELRRLHEVIEGRVVESLAKNSDG